MYPNFVGLYFKNRIKERMATTADATFRIDGQDVLSIQRERGKSRAVYKRGPSILRLGGSV